MPDTLALPAKNTTISNIENKVLPEKILINFRVLIKINIIKFKNIF
jgi:hypothetical protein